MVPEILVGDPGARARVDGWMDWSQISVQPDFLSGVFWVFYRTPEAERTGRRSAPRSSGPRCISKRSIDCWRAGHIC
jgi:hypothetical protein